MTRRRWSLLAAILVGVAVLAVVVATVWQLNTDRPPSQAAEPPSDPAASASADLAPCPANFGQRPDSAGSGSSGDSGDSDTLLPALTLPCLSGGGEIDLAGAPGTPTVLNVWASWCGPCAAELPHLQKLHDRAGDKVQVLGVDILDSRDQALPFAAATGMTFPSLFDAKGELQQWSGIPGPPFTLLIDADGTIVHRKIGQVASYDELRGLVETHLGVEVG